MPQRTHGMDDLDRSIITLLRKNSRCTLRYLSDISQAPLSTTFHRVKAILGSYITRTTVHLDLSEIAPIRVFLWIECTNSPTLLSLLHLHPTINTLCRIGPDSFYWAEGYFHTMMDLEDLLISLRELGCTNIVPRFVLEELSYEVFAPE